MNKLYSVHDHWTDINKKNDVDIESINGVITGIKVNGEDYSGTSWTEVFSGDVVTSGEAAPFVGTINANLSGSDTIKVVYNNTEYILPKQVTDDGIFYGATPGATPSDIDFSEIPFLIKLGEVDTALYTQSPGPQNITILEPQSGGGESDFSTANVTIKNRGGDMKSLNIPCCFESADAPFGFPFINYQTSPIAGGESQTFKVALYKGNALLSSELHLETTGNITYNDTYSMYIISGDCTISLSSIS